MPAIKPSEVAQQKIKDIPEEVLECWNSLIVKRMSGTHATVLQKDAVDALVETMGVTQTAVYELGWLDIEPIYRKAGWTVKYDKPGYNESYDASFEFSTKRRS